MKNSVTLPTNKQKENYLYNSFLLNFPHVKSYHNLNFPAQTSTRTAPCFLGKTFDLQNKN